MNSKEENDIIFAQLDSDEDFFKSLKKICEKHYIKNGLIVSGIGQFKNFKIGYYKKDMGYKICRFNKSHELLNLSGNIYKINNNFVYHIHAILSNEKMICIGGHLLKAEVDITNEIVILKTLIKFSRITEKISGLKKLVID